MAYGSPAAQRFYFGSPPWVQEVMLFLYGLKHRHASRGKYFEAWFRHLRDRQFDDPRATEERAFHSLTKVLECAWSKSPFYRHRFEQAGLKPSDIQCLTDLHKLPLLTKEDVRGNLNAMATFGSGESPHLTHTSGTTGTAIHLWLSQECYQREYAYRALHYSWAGVALGEPCAVLAGHPVVHVDSHRAPFSRRDHAENRLLFSSQHLHPDFAVNYVEELQRFRPAIIHGYPSSISWVADAVLRKGQSDIRPRAVFTSAESLLPWQRQLIEAAFGCKVFNWYGNAEHLANITECELGSLHVQPEHSYVEFLTDDGRPAHPGELANLVATTLVNLAMPLVRYVVGDKVVPSKNICACGRRTLLVDKIEGRVEDYVLGESGRVFGRLDHIFKDTHAVAEAQIVQREPGSVTIRIVRRPEYNDEDTRHLLAAAHARLGSDFKIDLQFVSAIERSNNGKFRFIVQKIPPRDALSSALHQTSAV